MHMQSFQEKDFGTELSWKEFDSSFTSNKLILGKKDINPNLKHVL